MVGKGNRHKSRATGPALAILGGRRSQRQVFPPLKPHPEMRLKLRRILSRNAPQVEVRSAQHKKGANYLKGKLHLIFWGNIVYYGKTADKEV